MQRVLLRVGVVALGLGACFEETGDGSGMESAGESESSSGASVTSVTTIGTTTEGTTTGVGTGTEESGETTEGCPAGSVGCPCDVGSSCEDDLVCMEGMCLPARGCFQPDEEPNDSESDAVMLPDLTDCDGPGEVVAGALDGPEQDWFRYQGEDTFNCIVDPFAMVDPGDGLMVCIFVACSDPTFTCMDGAVDEFTLEGRRGCCAPETVSITDLNCTGADDSATVFMRVDGAGDDACEPYELRYHF